MSSIIYSRVSRDARTAPSSGWSDGGAVRAGVEPLPHGAVHRGDHGLQARADDRAVDPDAPEDLALDGALHVGGGARVVARRHGALLVVEHPHVEPDAGQRVDERGEGAVAAALDLVEVVLHAHGGDDLVGALAVAGQAMA